MGPHGAIRQSHPRQASQGEDARVAEVPFFGLRWARANRCGRDWAGRKKWPEPAQAHMKPIAVGVLAAFA